MESNNTECEENEGCESSHVEITVSTQMKREADEREEHCVKRLRTEISQEAVAGQQQKLTGNNNEKNSVDIETLSKKQRKRHERLQKWLERRPEKRAQERERIKRNRMIARLNNIALGPSRNLLKRSTMAQSKCKIRVVVDLSFDELMSDLDIGKCVNQLLRCYSLNRRAENPMQLYFTNFNGKVEKEMEKHEGYRNWDIYFHSDSYTEAFDKSELLYLTSESDNVISALEENKVYIIGGLVDHNAHKGVCYRVAIDQKINHGQLPLTEFLDMKTRKVLTINHVFEILLYVSSGMNWKDAFLKVLPARKGATAKGNCDASTTPVKVSEEGHSAEPRAEKDLHVDCEREELDDDVSKATVTVTECV